MAKILMINLPFTGHTNPTLPLTEVLVKRGHSVYYVNAEEFRKKIENTGAEFIPYKNYPTFATEKQKKTMSFRAAFDTAISLEQNFDLLIYEMFFYPGIEIAKRLKIPCVRQFSQPAWNEKIISNAPFLYKLSCYLIDIQIMSKTDKKHMSLTDKTLLKAISSDKPTLNIVYVPDFFQSHRETFGEDYIFTVPLMENNFSNDTSRQIPFEAMKKPIVYISLGSIISYKGFYKKCIRTFANKDMSIILNTGRIKPEWLGKIPDNIYAYSFVPQIDVLRHSNVFLTHCGMNSVIEAMSYGVPMVVMPLINDQVSNAKRIIEIGIGKRIRFFPSSGRQLYKTVNAVSSDKHIRNRCLEVKSLLKMGTSLEETAIRIETLLSR